MRWLLLFLCLVIINPTVTFTVSAGGMNQIIKQKIEQDRELRRNQSRKFERVLRELRQQLRRKEIPDDVRIPKQRRYRQYRR